MIAIAQKYMIPGCGLEEDGRLTQKVGGTDPRQDANILLPDDSFLKVQVRKVDAFEARHGQRHKLPRSP